MTRKRNDNYSTEFGLWLREQEELRSDLGYVATNLDYIWHNYRTGEWMLIEEKRYDSHLRFSQKEQFRLIDEVSRNDYNYRGFHLVVFERTSPADGLIKLNNNIIDFYDFIEFLGFRKYYPGYFDKEVAICQTLSG